MTGNRHLLAILVGLILAGAMLLPGRWRTVAVVAVSIVSAGVILWFG